MIHDFDNAQFHKRAFVTYFETLSLGQSSNFKHKRLDPSSGSVKNLGRQSRRDCTGVMTQLDI